MFDATARSGQLASLPGPTGTTATGGNTIKNDSYSHFPDQGKQAFCYQLFRKRPGTTGLTGTSWYLLIFNPFEFRASLKLHG